MSAPPIGMISVTPSTNETSTISQNAGRLSAPISASDEQDQQDAEADVEGMPHRQHDRLAAHVAVELGRRDDRAGEGDRPDGHAERHLEQRRRP